MGEKKRLRLDKILAHLGFGSRKEIKKSMRSWVVTVNGVHITDPGTQVDPNQDPIIVNGEQIFYREFVYLMMNKPQGVISATEDLREHVVVDLLDEEYRLFDPFPVGRLDKDTEGLLLLTNDGKLSHRLLSPKKQVPKRYFAKVKGEVTEEDIHIFRKGVILEDGYHTLPGELTILHSAPISEIELTIYEGKFHQVKRMFQAVEKEVIYLQRIQMGSLQLDPSLPLGSYRELSEVELHTLIESIDSPHSK
ncbi:pseudouridine synthase [Hazenella coriacea]|uniref:Pseudouridine synthase n=1 Tax=Hazenella coriacea TaxID=1179467 RepID=A0A4R3L9R2_9BACL|nr:pseudouridine synthase [Hazenella coriacea]TCS95968.1 ribosomal small subunit pseudouridine synthase A [Hazenella coriacea]